VFCVRSRWSGPVTSRESSHAGRTLQTPERPACRQVTALLPPRDFRQPPLTLAGPTTPQLAPRSAHERKSYSQVPKEGKPPPRRTRIQEVFPAPGSATATRRAACRRCTGPTPGQPHRLRQPSRRGVGSWLRSRQPSINHAAPLRLVTVVQRALVSGVSPKCEPHAHDSCKHVRRLELDQPNDYERYRQTRRTGRQS
jgi:hypothetical protein